MLEIVEYASIRLMLVCAIATTLPRAIDNTAATASISCQISIQSPSPEKSSRNRIAKAASFGTADK